MNLTELQTNLNKTLEDNKRLKSVERELEKTRVALNKAEQDLLRAKERIAKLRKKSDTYLDKLDENELFLSHAKLRFTSHINGVRALHVKARGVGKMFTSRESDISPLERAITYLRETVWSK